jgi:hypothetical protein
MSDLEFDVLDEIYFVHPYSQIKKMTQFEDAVLRDTLSQLFQKGWIKCFKSASEEIFDQEIDIQNHYQEYYYLASKAGLLAHNSK